MGSTYSRQEDLPPKKSDIFDKLVNLVGEFQPTLTWSDASCSQDKVILSLHNKSQLQYHVSVFKEPFVKSREFHVTCERVLDQQVKKICSTYYRFSKKGPEVIDQKRSNRRNCVDPNEDKLKKARVDVKIRGIAAAFWDDFLSKL